MSYCRMLFVPLLAFIVAPVYGKDIPAQEIRAGFQKMLDRPRLGLFPHVQPTQEPGEFDVEKGDFLSERDTDGTEERVPILLIKPKSATSKRPAVIVLHGTGGTKESQAGFMQELARKGIIGVAIDARYHGDRSAGTGGSKAYLEAITRAWRTKPGEPQPHPFYYDTVWDLWRTVDYLQSRPDVDPDRIGMVGFSMGGIETWLAASVDERVKVAIPAISVQSFKWSLENNQWQGRAKTVSLAHEAAAKDLGESEVNARVCRELWNKVIPGMLDQYDCPNMLKLFAGRPLLILNGETDPNCPIGGSEVAFASAREAFATIGKPEMLKIDVAKGVGHAVTKPQMEMALDWLVTWLKPAS